MDWSHELLASLLWLGQAFVLSVIGLSIAVVLVGRFTEWGRQFRRLTWSYFDPVRSKKPLIGLAFIIFLTLFSVRMNVLFSFWYNGFYSAMQKLDAKAFWFMLMIFSILATIHVVRALLNYYVRQAFLIDWRVWLSNNLMDRWLDKQVYYRSQYLPEDADNPDQRIQQDVTAFVTSSLTLSMGLLDAVVSLFAFSIILWGLSGALSLLGVEIPRAMIFLVYIYVIIATVFAIKVGRPLINLSFLSEKFSADFRYALIRLREYGESIAFFRGEVVERSNLLKRFGNVIDNMWDIVSRSLKFQGLNLVVSQAAVVFPFIVQAPRLLNKQITLGDMMQTAQSFCHVQDALSFFRTSYDDFAGYRAVVNRLTGFLDLIDATEKLHGAKIEYAKMQNANQEIFEIQGLTVSRPDNMVLVQDLTITLPAASSLLIRGASGVGKTTLLRAIAGLWPYVDGKVRYQENQTSLFLPQKPYLPLGSLRAALYYPAMLDEINATNDQVMEILKQCHLSHLIARLDEENDWTRILSLGEQQRLAMGRVLLQQPQVVFLDEASSAMDEGLEHAMYQLLRSSLPATVLISVGHRSSLFEFHTQKLEILGQGQWRLCSI